MTILYPDQDGMLRIGSVSLHRDLGEQEMPPTAEYAITVQIDKDKFFKDFSYKMISSSPMGLPLDASTSFINTEGLQACMTDPDNAHFQLGTRFTLMRYAFPLDCNGFPVGPDQEIGSYRNIQGTEARVFLYAVFFDEFGNPVRHWSHSQQRSDEITVYYEYFGNDKDTFASSFEVDTKLPDALGVHALNTSDEDSSDTLVNLISGPLTIINADNETRTTFENSVMLQSAFPRIKGISMLPERDLGSLYYDSNGPIAITTDDITGMVANRINLVRARDAKLQTLVFAIVSDEATSKTGVTDALAMMMLRPDDIVLPYLYVDEFNAQLSIKDHNLVFDSMQGSYICRTITEALTIHFPAVVIDTNGIHVNIANLHKAMPRANLGSRLLQLYSLKYYQSSIDEKEDDISNDARRLLSIDHGIGSVMDISDEPEALEQDIIGQIESYLADEYTRSSFMLEFSRKYPGILETYARMFDPGTVCRLSDALDYARKAFSIYVSVSISYDIGGGQEVSIYDVPVIFRLAK